MVPLGGDERSDERDDVLLCFLVTESGSDILYFRGPVWLWCWAVVVVMCDSGESTCDIPASRRDPFVTRVVGPQTVVMMIRVIQKDRLTSRRDISIIKERAREEDVSNAAAELAESRTAITSALLCACCRFSRFVGSDQHSMDGIDEGLQDTPPPIWVPFFTLLVNVVVSFLDNDPVQCIRYQLLDGTFTSFTWFGGLRLFLLFTCLFSGLQMLWKLPISTEIDTKRYRCILTSFSLFVMPLGRIPPWYYRDFFSCVTQSWGFVHWFALTMSVYIVKCAHYPPPNKRAALEEAPVRPVEPMHAYTPEAVKKKGFPPTSMLSLAISPENSKNRIPAKVASERRLRLTNSAEVTDGLEPVRKQDWHEIVPVALAAPVYGSAPASAPASTVFSSAPMGSSVPKGGGKKRDPCPSHVFVPAAARNKPPLAANEEAPNLDDFWKKHALWGEVVLEKRSDGKEIKFFSDVNRTTQKPFTDSSNIKQWIEQSCRDSAGQGKYLDQQHVIRTGFKADQRDGLHRALDARSSPNEVEKFYWLLLRLVYSSSMLKQGEIEKSWWFSKDVDSIDTPNNFCSVLREIHKADVDVFTKYSMFNKVVHYHFEGLESAYAKKEPRKIEECIDWFRSLPLIGVRNAKTHFEEFLKVLDDPSAILKIEPPNDDSLAKSKLQLLTKDSFHGVPSYEQARVSARTSSEATFIPFSSTLHRNQPVIHFSGLHRSYTWRLLLEASGCGTEAGSI
jgi:hypothetical protein